MKLSLFAVVSLVTPLAYSGVVFSEDFNNFTGAGFAPIPPAGQLDSDFWKVTGLSDGDLDFGDTNTSGDSARGQNTGGVTTGGIYAFEVATGDYALGVQPGGSDFTPGSIILKLTNTTGLTWTEFDVAYDVFAFNDQGRANSLNFSSSTDDATYTPVPALDFTSPESADSVAAWMSESRSTTVSGIVLAPGQHVYLRWLGDDVSGSGSRDEFAIDNVRVSIAAIPEPSLLFPLTALALGALLVRRRR